MAEKRTRRRFTVEFKAQAVKRLLEGGRGLSEVASELVVRHRHLIPIPWVEEAHSRRGQHIGGRYLLSASDH